jgi:hypothetical protein
MSWRMLLAAMIGATVFIADAFTTERGAPLKGAVSVLYIAVIVLVANQVSSRRLLAVGLVCALAAAFAYFKEHGRESLGAACPVVLMTAFPTDAARAQASVAGAAAFLVKPVDPDALLDLIMKLANGG